jgi:two-component system, cell cycle sensor histidine kinase and response regulator CckA
LQVARGTAPSGGHWRRTPAYNITAVAPFTPHRVPSSDTSSSLPPVDALAAVDALSAVGVTGTRTVAVAAWSQDGRILDANEAFLALVGATHEELTGGTLSWDALEDPVAAASTRVMRTLVAEAGMAPPYETLLRHRDGTTVPVLVVVTTLDRERGVGWCFALDLRSQKATEAALRSSEERYRLVTGAAGGAIWEWDLAADSICFLDGMMDRYGWEVRGEALPLTWWHERIHPDDVGAVLATAEEVHASRVENATHAYRFRRADDTWAMVHDHFHVVRDPNGRAERVLGVMLDTTERHALEEQLRQAQKMDAVGRLAGGVAHDFNNLLTVIRGNAALLLERVTTDNELRSELQEIERAAARASDLTRQLLAFGRKQVLQPHELDLNAVVAQLTRMIDRLIPKTIAVVLTPASHVGLVRADRGQIEQVILNLVINARDAMPSGGQLELRTGELGVGKAFGGWQADNPVVPPDVPVRPGKYIHLSVSDTGSGMDEATRTRAFEPFFTTKPVGEGTGLGLATVYGIVKQSDGYVWIDSQPGRGTTVHVCLPRVDGEVRPPRTSPHAIPAVAGPRTVLLVEDEDGVRDLTQRVLERQGYIVHVARDGVEALALYADHKQTIDVLVTDVVMPRLGGSELVIKVRAERPDLPVLFMSGYARNAAIRGAPGDRRTRFLQKPFTVPAFQQAVAELLAYAGASRTRS